MTDHPPDSNPKTRVGLAKAPLHLVPPSVLVYLAAAFREGAAKYGPYNWRNEKISTSVYYAAALRHLTAWWDGEDDATDSGAHHLAHAMACLALILDGKSCAMLNDDRPPAGGTPRLLEEAIRVDETCKSPLSPIQAAHEYDEQVRGHFFRRCRTRNFDPYRKDKDAGN